MGDETTCAAAHLLRRRARHEFGDVVPDARVGGVELGGVHERPQHQVQRHRAGRRHAATARVRHLPSSDRYGQLALSSKIMELSAVDGIVRVQVLCRAHRDSILRAWLINFDLLQLYKKGQGL